LPFRGETSGVIFEGIMNRAPVAPVRLNPDLPPKLEDIINRALEKDRELRYQHAADMKSELLRLKRDLASGQREGPPSSAAIPVSPPASGTMPALPAMQPISGSASTAQPTSGSAPAVATISSTSTPAVPVAQTTSASAITAVAEQSRWSWKLVTPVILLLVALGVAGGFYWRAHQIPKLTDKDQLILADFTNNTGDTVFDATLKEALAIQLEQSPLIQLVSDAELHNNLQYLGQTKDQRITPELAQQIGQRLGVKAYLSGTIAPLGSSYVISINAVNCATGDVFAREQVTAPDKAGVLAAVSNAATEFRARLGESLVSIQKLSTPYTNVTTASLQAFHAFSLGEDEHRMGRDFPQASTFYEQAVRLDPNFAMGYARLGVVFGNQGATTKALEYLRKAYDLRQHVTERERMYIESQYALQQFDLPKALESYKLFVATYPRDAAAWNNLATTYQIIGDLEQAAAGSQKAWEVAKWNNVAANNAAGTSLALDRLPEGERYLKEALEQGGSDDVNYHLNALLDNFMENRPDWDKELQWAANRPDGFGVEIATGTINFFLGKIHTADQQWEHAAQRIEQQHLPDAAGGVYAFKALHDALVTNCAPARETARRALALDHSVATVPNAALALALCGESAPALQEIERLASAAPTNTLVNDVYLPQVKAAVALAQHRSRQVSGLLTPASAYVLVSKAPQLLGRAALENSEWQQAATAFQQGLRYKGWSLAEGGGATQTPDYSLCLLGTARAQSHIDKAAATRSYQQLLDIWKNADPDFIPAQEAKREYAALSSQPTR